MSETMVTSLPLPAGLPLDAASWAQTPLVVCQVVLQLVEIIQQQHTTIQQLEARLQTLEARIAELEARVQQRSRNSDRPPSSDPPYEKRPARAGIQGKPGAKPGLSLR
jgi:transposase